NPISFEQRPPVAGQAVQDIIIRKPAVAIVSPGAAPAVPDEQSALARFFVGWIDYDLAIIISYRADGVSTHHLFPPGWIGYLPAACCQVDGGVNCKAEHGRQSRP